MIDGLRVHLYCLCWNDARMLPFFFRHYDKFVDRYFIFDNGSTDRSLALLQEHGNVSISHFDVHGDSFVDEERRLGDTIWKGSHADWVIVTDIDEHVYRPNLREYLGQCKQKGVTAIKSIGYEMVSDSFPTGNKPLVELVTLGARSTGHDRLCIFNPQAITETNYEPGRHNAFPEGEVVWPEHREILLLHFKQLGPEYPILRSAELRQGLKARDLEAGWGMHYSWSSEEIRKNWQEMRSMSFTVPGLGVLGHIKPAYYDIQERRVEESGLVDDEWYLREYPDVEASEFDALSHFCIHGWKEGRKPNFYFEPVWYTENYPEFSTVGQNPLFDYITKGEVADARPSPHFDTAWYRKKHGLTRNESPLLHYLRNRTNPSFSPLPGFDAAQYCFEHPETLETGEDPFESHCRQSAA